MRIIIVGAGEVGYHIARRLASENKDVVIIDTSADALKRVSEHLDVQTMQGSGASPVVLQEAGVKRAEILLAVTDSDETNLVCCLYANALAPHIHKIARLREQDFVDFKAPAGRDPLEIDRIINPEVETVKAIMRLISLPQVVEVNEFGDGRIQMLGIYVEAHARAAGCPLTELRRKVGLPVIVGAIVRDNRLTVPTGADEIRSGDTVYVVCDKNDLDPVLDFFGVPVGQTRNILIIGGGNVGYRLAKELDTRQYHLKIIEADPIRSQYLSAKLDRPVVLQGDGTDQSLLAEENIGRMDMVIALTRDDETNVLSCLLAKSMGAHLTVARVNKFAYIPLVQAIGIRHIVSTRLSAINSILHAIRRGKVLSTVSIKGEEAEAMEAVALENSEVVGKPIRKLDFPKGSIVLCVMRGEDVIIPSGDFVILPQDRIIILSFTRNIPRVEKALMVKLEYF